MIPKNDLQLLSELFFSTSNENVSREKIRLIWLSCVNEIQVANEGELITLIVECGEPSTLQDSVDYIIDLTNKGKGLKNYQSTSFRYLTNPDGSLRWVYPVSLKRATFLNFYSSLTKKDKIKEFVFRNIFRTPLRTFLADGTFTIYHKGNLSLDKLIKSLHASSYSLFLGTPNPDRKAIVELNDGRNTMSYLKIPLRGKSFELVEQEAKMLDELNQEDLKDLILPKNITWDHRSVLCSSNVRSPKSKRSMEFGQYHIKALRNLYEIEVSYEDIQETKFLVKCGIENSVRKHYQVIGKFKRLDALLNQVLDSIDTTASIPLAFAHGDFTPWNCFIDKEALAVVDWENGDPAKPLLYDLFHFVFQTGILVKRDSYKKIKNDLNRALSLPEVHQVIVSYGIDVQLHLSLYLAINISHYLNVYLRQEKLHTQVDWLFEVWEEALLDVLSIKADKSNRQEAISSFIERIKNKRYAVLKFTEYELKAIKESSDLDVLVCKEDLQSMVAYLTSKSTVEKHFVQALSYMTKVELFFRDGSFLSVDLIHRFKRKTTTYLDSYRLLIAARPNKAGIMVPDVKMDFEYIFLFYLLNGASVPHKYQVYFGRLNFFEKVRIAKYIQGRYLLPSECISSLCRYSKFKHAKVAKRINTYKRNNLFRRGVNFVLHVIDKAIEFRHNLGFIITVSGVDGAGKSTVIDKLKVKVAQKYRRKVVVLRHRPSLIPILSSYTKGKERAESLAAKRLPRMGTNQSIVGSLFRFSYYFIDYFFGQFYVFFKYVMFGYIVIYDRYYYDFINDSKRSNIVLPQILPKGLFRILLKPRLNVFLHASASVIQRRKKELNANTIDKLNKRYISLFREFDKKYGKSRFVALENIELNRTLQFIMKEFSRAA